MHRILVIEDDPTGTQLLLTLLDLEGYEGCKPEDWADPLHDVETQRPDLVILDVHLPSQDGFELLRRLRAHADPAVARIPVLMVSAENLRAQCLSAGADGFVEKPYDLETLLDAIRRTVEESVLTN